MDLADRLYFIYILLFASSKLRVRSIHELKLKAIHDFLNFRKFELDMSSYNYALAWGKHVYLNDKVDII